MAIELRDASLGPIHQLTVSAPDGAVIGVIGLAGEGLDELVELASVQCHSLTVKDSDAVRKAELAASAEERRRKGETVLVAAFDVDFLERISDEIWWLRNGKLAAQGDPREIARKFREFVAEEIRTRNWYPQVPPSLRRGDGRAELLEVQAVNGAGAPSMILRSGEEMAIRVVVKFHAPVENPVVGIMIRTRIGSEVYGTNTELEKFDIGRVEAGERRTLTFSFRCDLCPQEYAVTAASHDPNGVWHDWMEDALAFVVVDDRYTAGVANLKARVK